MSSKTIAGSRPSEMGQSSMSQKTPLGYAKVGTVTISELNEFINTALTQCAVVDMEGKTWKEKHSPYNFTSNHQTFTVTRILNERECVPHPDFVNNSAMNTGTAPTGDEQKTPPENASLKMVKKALMAWHKL
ncbi:hypothetical protein DY000_02003214 [Brassica cretica]|uniref:Uncharacterized protein n=1 Tax=Brassica cretica TaxID=69181 RepID=A0ABQ7CG06_BRACR|nr:hypothetical protein DY000_02003214 [Brassica cretica]